MSDELMKKVNESIAAIRGKTSIKPELALVLGSGLGPLADQITEPCSIAYTEIPHFMKSTAPGHEGRLILGYFAGKPVLCMQGRFHYYEGYSQKEITYPIRVMAKLGIRTLILTNACGSLKREFCPGDIMLITDHVNFTGMNPLIGQNEDEFGPRFPDMSRIYTPELLKLCRETAEDMDMDLREGVYLGYSGPSFETPAEIRLFQSWGASAVGMSTVAEAIVARHCGLKILALSCLTNMAAGILDQPITAEEVVEAANGAGERFRRLLSEVIKRI
ncbi:MAG: purine-nucleoside phosphorylase [Treponema sp.]|jgi:purine-nucleoside phosphorylase|nr:purine-nucleoside phosphorylase [Treponema sp.]